MTWGWLAVYTVVPVLMIVVTAHQLRRRMPDPHRSRRLPGWVRLALLALAFILGFVGLALFLVPGVAASWWPWPLTPLTSRAVGAWLISLGVAAAHGLIENDVTRIRPLGVTAVVFSVLEGVALLRYGGELDWSSLAAIGYLAVLAALLVLGVWALSGQDARADQDVTDERDLVVRGVEQRSAHPAGVDQAE